MDVGRDVAAVMGQQSDWVMGLRVQRHPPLGDGDVASVGAGSQRVHRQGGTWGSQKPRASPRLPQEGFASGAPAHGAWIRNLGAFWVV